MRTAWLLLLVGGLLSLVAWAGDDNPAQRQRATVLLKRVDAGTLPTPALGTIVYDVIDQRLLISDGGTWAPVCP